MMETKFLENMAGELSVSPQHIAAAVLLLEGGATIPFIAQYRKDAVGNLNETQLETIVECANYFTGVLARRVNILDAIAKQDKLTGELRARIEACFDKAMLEDLYLPYKARRRTKATVAEERGLAPLADFILRQLPGLNTLEEFADAFVKPEKSISSPEEAIEGACYIMVERFVMDAELRALLRECMWKEGKIAARATKNAGAAPTAGLRPPPAENAEAKGGGRNPAVGGGRNPAVGGGRNPAVKTKYAAYSDFSEPLAAIPSHRLLAILRGVKESLLRVDIVIDDEKIFNAALGKYLKETGSVFEPHIRRTLDEAYSRHLRPSIEKEVLDLARRDADEEAIRVCRENADHLLMAPPAGAINVAGIVPLAKTGCKVAVIDGAGALLEYALIEFQEDQEDTASAEQTLLDLLQKHNTYALAIANNKGSRQTAKLVSRVLDKLGRRDAFTVTTDGAAASFIAASHFAREEFPELEAAYREAVAIARRIQNPLAELVKAEPRSIGVGQYQHDVNQKLLREKLSHTVVSCVSRIGVDLNTASVALLRYVSGLQMGTAQNIVAFRNTNGAFRARTQLLEVDGIGPRVYEQCAGFLRIANGDNPLDATAIHPEAYPVVEQISQRLDVPVAQLMRNREALGQVKLDEIQQDAIGPLVLADIQEELLNPGRDPRRRFKAPRAARSMASVSELEEGAETEGVVSNVTDFGAFVNIGIEQDGLVHLSELSNRFVKDPREVIKVGDVVKVKIIKVDKDIPRISLSIKALLPPPQRRPARNAPTEQAAETQQAPPSETPDQRGRPPRVRRDKPEQQGERRDSRPPRPEQGDRRDTPRPARPDNRERSRDFPGGDRDRKSARRPSGPGSSRNAPQTTRSGNDSGPLNTLLAEQLAALRDKFPS